jgi:hypothetical protein
MPCLPQAGVKTFSAQVKTTNWCLVFTRVAKAFATKQKTLTSECFLLVKILNRIN